LRAIVVNAGNANACTGVAGDEAAQAMVRAVSSRLGCPEHEVLVASTGVIGVPLPMDRVLAGIEAAHADLAPDVEGGRRFLTAIQTTDAFEKEACEALPGGARVVGVAKGAGMIEPNMATMLAFLGTDLPLEVAELAAQAPRLADGSFNRVYVDGHSSTNDSFFLFATGRAEGGSTSFDAPAMRVAQRLAWLIARDGEGASKVTTIRVRGARSNDAARAIAREVAASALVRTALFGNDPNWGRFVSQVGNSPHLDRPEALRCLLQGVLVFEAGEPTGFDRAALSQAMASEDVALEMELGDGAGAAELLTSDLGYRYVEVNAEYTT
jgi:glutamate N-acetyltransferase/amino-acid N-acetyltransferase